MESSYRNILSPAKLNLILKVGGKRKDGFHEIESLMLPLNWGDRIHLQVRQSSITQIQLHTPGFDLPPEKNLAYRAAQAFSEKLPVLLNTQIRIEKHIPESAGLGGGSSNAVTVLQLLADWYQKKIGKLPKIQKKLYEIALSLGSDLPFFLLKSPAWCRGRGERCQQLSFRRAYWVVVFSELKISTKEAYRWLSQTGPRNPLKGQMPSWLSRASFDIPALENDFEELIVRKYPQLQQLRSLLAQSGAQALRMSGSGPCFFGYFLTKNAAQKAARWLRAQGLSVIESSTLET